MEPRQPEAGLSLKLSSVALLVLLAAVPAHAQFISLVKSNAIVGGTNFYTPTNFTTYFTVTGRITSAFMSFTNSTEIYIQDTSSGIRVTSSGGSFQLETNSAVFQTGMEVVVVGRIGQTNGLRMIRPEFYDGDPYSTLNDFYLSDTNPAPVAPEVTTISNLLANAEDYEGELVRINGVLPADTNTFSYKLSTDLTVTDATASITLFIDRDTEIDGQLPPTNTFDLIGIVGQFSTNAIPSNSYEIIARFYSDLIQTVGSQAPALPLATSATAVVNVPFRLDIVAQDRNAGDTLTVTNTLAPGTATFSYGNREGVASWTPSISDLGTTNRFTFEVSDGSTVVTSTCAVVVRPASGGPGYAWINEFHYDNVGTDTNEFVEVAGEAGINLTNYYIILYNGGSGNSYLSNNLTGVIDDEGNGYGAVTVILNPGSGIQNGSPDGIALGSKSNGVLQFISYEGTMIANNGPAAGIASIDVGVAEQDPVPAAGTSLQLQGNGTNYEAFTWTDPATATPGEINGCGQIIVGPANAKVTLSALTLNPAIPRTNQTFYIDVQASANCSASNVAITTYYSLNGGSTNSLATTFVGSNTYRSSSQVAGQTNGTIVAYFAGATFTGPGTNSPTYTQTNTFTVVVNVPILSAIGNKTVTESNNLTFAVNATEADGDPVTLSVSNAPAGSTFTTTNLTGNFTWTNPAPVGVYTMTFYAADADGSDSETITITVASLPASGTNLLVAYEFDFGTNIFTNVATSVSTQLAASILGVATGTPNNVQGNPTTGRSMSVNSWTSTAQYFTFTITPSSGYQVAMSSLSFHHQRSSTGPTNWFLRYSGDGFSTDLGSGTNSANWISNSVSLAVPTQSGSVTFRFFATNTVAGTGTWRLDNVKLYGSIQSAGSDPDDDDDLLPNEWENQYFGGNTNATATEDTDGDGFDNLSEFISFTDPTDSNLYFQVEAITNATSRFVTFDSVTGRNYSVDFIGNLLDGTSWTNLQSGVPGTGGPLSISDTNAETFRNYRIGVQMQ